MSFSFNVAKNQNENAHLSKNMYWTIVSQMEELCIFQVYLIFRRKNILIVCYFKVSNYSVNNKVNLNILIVSLLILKYQMEDILS